MSRASASGARHQPASRPAPAGSRRKRQSPFEALALAGGAVLGAQHASAVGHSRCRPRTTGCHLCRDPGRLRAVDGDRAREPSPSTTSPGRPGWPRPRCPARSPGPGRVNAATAERIRQVADDARLPHQPAGPGAVDRPHAHARAGGLRRGNPFYAEIVRGAQARGDRRPATPCCSPTARSPTGWSAASLERALPSVDGVVLAGSRMSDSAIRMIAKQKPVVVLSRAVVDVPSVVPDNARGARLAVEHLAGLGHSRADLRGRARGVLGRRDALALAAGDRRGAAAAAAAASDRSRPTSPAASGPPRSWSPSRRRPSSPTTTSWRSARPRAARPRASGCRRRQRGRLRQHRRRRAGHPGADHGRRAAARRRRGGDPGTAGHGAGGAGPGPGRRWCCPVRLVVRGSTAQRSRKSTSPASGTTNVSPSAAQASTSTDAGSR